jgi:hypothetical protein
VEAGGGLVRERQRWLRRDRTCERDAPAFRRREPLDALTRQVGSFEFCRSLASESAPVLIIERMTPTAPP